MSQPSMLRGITSIVPRLAPAFVISFLFYAAVWTALLFREVHRLIRWFGSVALPPLFEDLLIAIFAVVFYAAGLFLAYNLAVLTNWAVLKYILKPAPVDSKQQPEKPKPEQPPDDQLENVKSIGIVLAGGGAKGAFQAGAMKAIYQFLAERNALGKVTAISATSIGSWNALFWLASLIKSKDGWDDKGPHELWWRRIRLRSLVTPSWYVPGMRNAFFETTPWQQNFDEIFRQDDVCREIMSSSTKFYFTSSHVTSGRLECTTNDLDIEDMARVKFRYVDAARGARHFMDRVKDGVFASMDLPPLFPYAEIDDSSFEDGGVIDNLPIMFPAMKSCEIIFVLPLNSDFAAVLNQRSLLKRLLRVMDVRQGALENYSFKGQYLYNELAVLRKYAQALEQKLATAGGLPPSTMPATLKRALERKHHEARIFAICPQRSFVERTIDTQELWKWKQAGVAFSEMYKQSKYLLDNYFDASSEEIMIALIDEGASPRVSKDF